MAQQQAAAGSGAATTPGKVRFITGASRGFDRIWTEATLQRGDKVAATARTLASLADLPATYGSNVLTLAMDVTQPDQVTAAVTQAHAHFGRLDVVLNNAGYSLVGTIEEASAADVRALYDTNIFGTLAPYLGHPAAAAGPGQRAHHWRFEWTKTGDPPADWLLLLL